MRFNTILIDIDDTLFNFRKSSFEALAESFRRIGRSFTWDDMPGYEVYNNKMWQMFERGEIEKEAIFEERFRQYFAEKGIEADTAAFNACYIEQLSLGINFMPHAEDLLRALHGKYRVFVVTNGDTYAQERRIRRSGLAAYFDGVFISEQLGCKKPDKAFFDAVFAIIGEDSRKTALMVGDSLSSDMQGGRNAGISTCLYGKREKADERCDYVIEDLLDLLPILENT